MQKLRTFLMRVKSMSFERMKMYARKAAADSGRGYWGIMLDMVICALRYGVGYLDYYSFGFAHLSADKRRTYMTMNDNLRIARSLNVQSQREYFEDKALFAKSFTDMFRREFIDLRTSTAQDLASLIQRSGGVAFAKATGGYGGFGVRRITAADAQDPEALFAELLSKEMYLVEQAITQHPKMNELCPTSVNTIRMVTLEKDGKATLMYSLVRMGGGSSYVDNISSGGMYCPVDENGILTAPAFCDKTGEYYAQHPATHTRFVGFELPYFEQAKQMVLSAAMRIEGVRYIGWDVAIAPDGPLLVEGNTLPGYDMCQNYRHLGKEKVGIRPKFVEVLGDEFYKNA